MTSPSSAERGRAPPARPRGFTATVDRAPDLERKVHRWRGMLRSRRPLYPVVCRNPAATADTVSFRHLLIEPPLRSEPIWLSPACEKEGESAPADPFG